MLQRNLGPKKISSWVAYVLDRERSEQKGIPLLLKHAKPCHYFITSTQRGRRRGRENVRGAITGGKWRITAAAFILRWVIRLRRARREIITRYERKRFAEMTLAYLISVCRRLPIAAPLTLQPFSAINYNSAEPAAFWTRLPTRRPGSHGVPRRARWHTAAGLLLLLQPVVLWHARLLDLQAWFRKAETPTPNYC